MNKTMDVSTCTKSLFFEVEGVKFYVPKRGLEESEVFQTMLNLPCINPDDKAEGENENNAIVLNGLRAEDFQAFIGTLYPELRTGTQRRGEAEIISALSLATMWSFLCIRDQLIGDLIGLELPPARLLELARIHNFQEGTKNAIQALGCRSEPPSLEEARQMGLDFFFKITQLRDNRSSAMLHAVDSCMRHGAIKFSETGYRCPQHNQKQKNELDALRTALQPIHCGYFVENFYGWVGQCRVAA